MVGDCLASIDSIVRISDVAIVPVGALVTVTVVLCSSVLVAVSVESLAASSIKLQL